mmetsp:Transcript_10962/g.9696  ORF Transcript_10962/g.9696 Transcript_10962/m.9696 type:complete len:107 (-) Transcript_10962:108-428(-)
MSYKFKFERTLVVESLENNTWTFPIFINIWYSIVDIIPVIAQVISTNLVIKDNRKAIPKPKYSVSESIQIRRESGDTRDASLITTYQEDEFGSYIDRRNGTLASIK